MANKQQTLFALDCGATNWRLYRVEYKFFDDRVQMLGDPQPSPMTSFTDRKLPAVICLDPKGTNIECFGDTAQQNLEDEKQRERVRDHFKPCIGAHLEENPLPHQKRYTHAQALTYTKMLLESVLEQIRREKWRAEAFDDRVVFTFAYPVHWRYDHNGEVFKDFMDVIAGSFADGRQEIRYVAEPEGAILCLRRRGLLNSQDGSGVTLIIDVGGSTTDIVAGNLDPTTNELIFMGRYGEPFGGGLYDAELAKHIADEMNIPASTLAEDPSALVSLRISCQRLKESLSRQLLSPGQIDRVPQRAITLVTADGGVYRRTVSLDESRFQDISQHLNQRFATLIDNAMHRINLTEEGVGQVVLVGGGAQLFSIIEYLRRRYGTEKVVLADNPEEIVVQGIGLELAAFSEKKELTILFQAELPDIKKASEEFIPPERSDWVLISEAQIAHPIRLGTNTIGRGEDNLIQLDDLKASRAHAEIQLSPEGIRIIDLGSTNGTFINGKKLTPKQARELQHDDEIIFGKSKYFLGKQLANKE